MDWKQRFIYRPHPAVTVVLLALSLGFLWHTVSSNSVDAYDYAQNGTLLEGTVVKVVSEEDASTGVGTGTHRVQNLLVRLDEPDGREVMVYNDLMLLEPDDRLYVGASRYRTADESFSIMDYQRAGGLAWLAVLFVVLVVSVSGRKGLDALAGMTFAGAVIFGYVVPALLGGVDPFSVGLIGAAIILVGTFYISYGFNRKSLAALVGVCTTLIITGLLGRWSVGSLRFTGFADESVLYLNSQTGGSLDLVGLVVAGIIIAAVGVLDDVAVTQSSTVMELAHAGTARGWRLFRQAMRVGNDHISAVTNTLLLAYAGASLPLILLLHTSDFPFGFALGGELVAEEAVRILVSSMGLVLAVPLTTLVAVAVVRRWGPGQSDGHRH